MPYPCCYFFLLSPHGGRPRELIYFRPQHALPRCWVNLPSDVPLIPLVFQAIGLFLFVQLPLMWMASPQGSCCFFNFLSLWLQCVLCSDRLSFPAFPPSFIVRSWLISLFLSYYLAYSRLAVFRHECSTACFGLSSHDRLSFPLAFGFTCSTSLGRIRSVAFSADLPRLSRFVRFRLVYCTRYTRFLPRLSFSHALSRISLPQPGGGAQRR